MENDGAFCNLIDSVDMTFTDAYVFTPTLTDALCFGYCDGIAQVDVTGGNSVAGLNFDVDQRPARDRPEHHRRSVHG